MKKKGFTLVELLVVIAIIALLLAIIIPSMSKARESAKRVICSNQFKSVGSGMVMYAGEYNNIMPYYGGTDSIYYGTCRYSATPADEAHPYAAYRAVPTTYTEKCDSTSKPLPMKLACLYAKGIIKDARIFYCPSNVDLVYRYESYTNPPPWGTLPQEFNKTQSNEWVRIGVTYYPTDPSVKPPTSGTPTGGAPAYSARRWDGLEAKIPYMSDLLWKKSSTSHRVGGSYGLNALFKDGHVVFCTDTKIFTSDLWDRWSPPNGGTATIDYRYFFFNIFRMIQP